MLCCGPSDSRDKGALIKRGAAASRPPGVAATIGWRGAGTILSFRKKLPRRPLFSDALFIRKSLSKLDKEMATFGYARVSTRDQDLAGQIAELQAAGCGNIFKEKVSGAKTDRPQLAKVIRRLESGDVLVVTRLDRLARSTRDLLNIIDAIGKAGAGFRSLHDAWADTTTPHGKLMVTVLGGLAEFERELIRARTDDGRKRAKARGVRFGRPQALILQTRE